MTPTCMPTLTKCANPRAVQDSSDTGYCGSASTTASPTTGCSITMDPASSCAPSASMPGPMVVAWLLVREGSKHRTLPQNVRVPALRAMTSMGSALLYALMENGAIIRSVGTPAPPARLPIYPTCVWVCAMRGLSARAGYV